MRRDRPVSERLVVVASPAPQQRVQAATALHGVPRGQSRSAYTARLGRLLQTALVDSEEAVGVEAAHLSERILLLIWDEEMSGPCKTGRLQELQDLLLEYGIDESFA